MEFYAGMLIGFGIGSCIVMLVMLYVMAKIMREPKEDRAKLYENMRRQLDAMDKQIAAVTDIADAIRG